MAFRARYKKQIGRVYLNYYDIIVIGTEVVKGLKEEESSEQLIKMEVRKIEEAKKVFPTIDYIHDLCVPHPFKNNKDYNLSKEDKIEALDSMITKKKQSYESIKAFFKGTAKDTEKMVKKELDALIWYREIVEQGVI